MYVYVCFVVSLSLSLPALSFLSLLWIEIQRMNETEFAAASSVYRRERSQEQIESTLIQKEEGQEEELSSSL